MRNNEVILMVDTLRKLMRRGARINIIKILQKTHPADLALIFRSFNKTERINIFHLIPEVDSRADIVSELDDAITFDLFDNLDDKEIIKILLEMDYDDEQNLLRALPEEMQSRLLELMKEEESREIEALMEYPEESAGALMTPEVFALSEDYTAEEAINLIRENIETEMVFYLYVVDERNHLVGVISLRQLIVVAPKTKLKHIMIERVISVFPETDQEEVGRYVARYNFLALPVVDDENKLLGIITVDDIIDVIREETTEDLLQMAGAGKDKEIILKSSFEASRIRFPWLFTTWVGGLIAALVIGYFSDIVSQYVLLAAFIPVIAGMGGNIGTQSSTIITRGLATGRLNHDQILPIIFKEVRVGLILGISYGLFLGVASYFLYSADMMVALSVGLAITIAMVIATFVGTSGPIILTKMNVDPAISTGPIVTTIIDIAGIFIYLSIATQLSQMLG